MNHLSLQVVIKGHLRQDLLLPEGDFVVIGSSPKARLHLAHPSLLPEHLKIEWTGEALKIRDLNNPKNPSQSFVDKTSTTTISVADLEIELSWTTVGSLSGNTVVHGVPQKSSLSLPQSSQELNTVVQDVPPNEKPHEKVAELPRKIRTRPMPDPTVDKALGAYVRKTSLPFVGLSLSVLVFLVSVFIGQSTLGGLLSSSRVALVSGGMKDVVIMWSGYLMTKGWMVALPGALWVGFWFYKTRYRRNWDSIIKTGHVLCLLATLTWPYGWALLYGVSPVVSLRSFGLALKLKHVAEASSAQSLYTLQLRSYLNDFRGSSFLFKGLMENQRARVSAECKGVGNTGDKEKIKTCLILLSAVSTEAFDDTQPAILREIGARVAILTSLDGITRVMSMEGVGSPTIVYFLNALDLIGLSAEREDLLSLMLNQKFSARELADALIFLRTKVDQKLIQSQIDMKIPNSLRVSVPSPLELGI